MNDSIRKYIPSLVTLADNEVLSRVPTKEEVWLAVSSLDPDSATGPDGFTAKFFQSAREVMGVDVVLAVSDFFVRANLPRGVSATLLTPIPKVASP